MLLVFILFFLSIIMSGITTIPFFLGLLVVCTVVFKKSWVFFLALGLGLFLDLITIRALGYTALVLVIFVFLIRLYERKFETRTAAFVFISTFLGSLAYLRIFDYQQILLQSLLSSLFAVLLFKIFGRLSKRIMNYGVDLSFLIPDS